MSNPFSFRVLHGTAEYWNVVHALLEVNGRAKSVGWHMGITPDVSRCLYMLTGKRVVEKPKLQNVLNNAETKVVIALGVSEDRPCVS